MKKLLEIPFLTVCGLILFLSVPSYATTGIAYGIDSIDNTIYYNTGGTAKSDTLSNGSGGSLVAGCIATSGYYRRALVKFSMPTLPSGYVIDSVTLQLYAAKNAQNNTASRSFYIYKLTSPWGEGASVASTPGSGTGAKTGDATWIRTFYNAVSWTTAGGDYSSTLSATSNTITAAPATVSFKSSRGQMKTDVTNWLLSPSTNYGWIIKGNETTTLQASEFASFQTTLGSTYKPTLIIYYHY